LEGNSSLEDTMTSFEEENILVHGTSFRTSPLDVREALTLKKSEDEKLLYKVKTTLDVDECVILSTCNRVEFIIYRNHPEEVIDGIVKINEERAGFPLQKEHFYNFFGRDAIRHIFRVTASLDSMVLGEPQITGQVKSAYESSLKTGFIGKNLRKVFERAFFVAKRVRNETAIGENPNSVSSQAVELAESIFGDLSRRKAIVIGTGEMGEIAIKSFLSRGISKIYITSRTIERAEELCSIYSGEVLPFKDLYRGLEEVDIVLCSSAAPHYLITKDDIKNVMKKRMGNPIFLIDISLPRNIDPEAGKVDNVYLYHIDDLQQIVDKNIKKRREEAIKSEAIVEEEVEKFFKRINEEKVGPVIARVYETADSIRRKELEELFKMLGNIPEPQKKAIEDFSVNVVKKILHKPATKVKEVARNGEPSLAEAFFALFGEEDEIESRNEGK
jgi:glutamyl-tRNA reductase